MKRLMCICMTFMCMCAWGQDLNKIIAKVNNEAITSRDLDEYIKVFAQDEKTSEQLRQELLEHLIEEKLILHAARALEVEIPDDWVDGKINQLIAGYGTYEEFERSLIDEGLTVTLLKKKIEKDFLVRQAIDFFVGSRISISPKEVTDYYNAHEDEFSAPVSYVCWIAKSNKEAFLESLGSEIKGKGLEAVMDDHEGIFFKIESDEEGLKKEVREVVLSINEGEFMIRPIEGAFYLIYLQNAIPSHKRFLEEVKDQIYTALWKKEFDAKFTDWIKELKKDAVIKYYD